MEISSGVKTIWNLLSLLKLGHVSGEYHACSSISSSFLESLDVSVAVR